MAEVLIVFQIGVYRTRLRRVQPSFAFGKTQRFEVGFLQIGMCFYVLFSPWREKSTKRAPLKEKLRFSLRIFSLNDARRGFATLIARHTHLCPWCRVVGKRADQLGQSRQACSGQGFLRRLAYLDLAFPKREITVFLPLVRTPSQLARSLRDRVGRQLSTTRHYGHRCVRGAIKRGSAACAHHQGKGFSRETVGFLLNGASFGTFLSPGREKYIKQISNRQINPNLKTG